MTRPLVALLCLGLALAAGSTHFTAASFTASTAVAANAVQVDQLSNHFSVVPAGAVQPGTSTAVASGNVDSMSLNFGTVPSARAIASVFRITNVGSSSATAVLTMSSIPQITSAVFAASGSTSVTLAAGASTTLTVTTSSTVAGRGTGTLKLALGGSSWMYRTYSVAIDEAPEAPGAPTATPGIAGKISLSWGATSTTTNFAGYDVYRSTGGAYTKLTATPQSALTYNDTSTVDGTTYTYKIRAVSSGTPTLDSLDSTTVSAKADATPPTAPSAIALSNGGGAGNAYINSGNRGSISVSVTLASGSLSSDTLTVTLSDGSHASTKTAAASAGAGSVTVSGFDTGAFSDGNVTLSVTSTDQAGNVSSSRTATVTKDTAAPGAPVAGYTDNNNLPDQIGGTAEANATITITETAPQANTYTTTANGSGAYSRTVDTVNGKSGAKINVAYSVTATDAAGNVSAATSVTFADAR